ncbi:MAG TPA: T9SS type A sorting domain-containing protein [Bacteroidota bacterium]|nr:T9SS type A sorting domain-containing protein [Bacteroidota bacterium]
MAQSVRVMFFLFFLAGQCFSQVLVNGDFESGRNSGWVEYSSGGYTLIATGSSFSSTEIQPPVNPRSGTWMGRIGGFSYEINSVSQSVTLPNTSPLYLGFYAQTRTASTSECAGLFVGAKVLLIINAQVIDSSYLCTYNDYHNWTFFYVNVSTLAGQSMEVVFKAEAANSVWSYLYIDDVNITTTVPVDEDQVNTLPVSFELEQNYPNPFNPQTSMQFSLPTPSLVTIKLYNLLGQEIQTLVEQQQYQIGTHTISFDGRDLQSGVYMYRLTFIPENGEKPLQLMRRMVLLK